MPDATSKDIDEMETLYGAIARWARAGVGVTASGMQVRTLPPAWDGYPEHEHELTRLAAVKRRRG